ERSTNVIHYYSANPCGQATIAHGAGFPICSQAMTAADRCGCAPAAKRWRLAISFWKAQQERPPAPAAGSTSAAAPIFTASARNDRRSFPRSVRLARLPLPPRFAKQEEEGHQHRPDADRHEHRQEQVPAFLGEPAAVVVEDRRRHEAQGVQKRDEK